MNWAVMGPLLGDLLKGGIGKEGYDDISGRIKDMQTELGNYGGEGLWGEIQGDVERQGGFKGYSMKSGIGTSGMDNQGNMNMLLGDSQQGYSDQMRKGAMSMYDRAGTNNFGTQAQSFFDRAAQDPSQRENDIYNRVRAMQRPGEDRQYSSMNSNLFGGGRGGITSGEFGGSPEQMAFGKAQAEARNTASFNAMGQAQQEMQNYQSMGSNLYGMGQQDQSLYGQLGGQMGQAQYDPYNQMLQQNQQAMQGGNMMNQSGQNMAGLLAQLGIGSASTGVNLQQVDAQAFQGLMEMLGMAAGGIGGALGTINP